MTALTGFRVVELGELESAAYCGKLFADFGAEVVKIERPGGDPSRFAPPLIDIGGRARESAYFAWLNTNKRSATADLANSGDAEAIKRLIASSDVLIDGREPKPVVSGPLSHSELLTIAPQLIAIGISWFGETGPYRDYLATDSTCRALAGLVKLVGPLEAPIMLTEHQACIPGGLSAFIAAASGLFNRRSGRRFSVSVHEANIALSELGVGRAEGFNLPEARLGINRFVPTFPLGIYPCREGWLGVTVLTPEQWRSFCALLDLPEVARDPRFALSVDRLRHADELEQLYLPRLARRTALEWFEEGRKRKIPFVPVPDMKDLLERQVHRTRGAFGSVRIGKAEFEGPALPQHLTGTPPAAGGDSPLAGADTGLLRDAAARKATAPSYIKAEHLSPSLPLEGLRIVDLAMGWAGPLATRHMADLGATVIKVESCTYPDWWRGVDFSADAVELRSYEKSMIFNIMNRNKSGVALDLTRPEGRDILLRLVADADAVIENYSASVMPKLGLGYPDLCKVNPELVMVSMPAFGSESDWRDVRAYGSTLEQGSGLPSVTGCADWPPTHNHLAYGDPIGGLNAAAALLIALIHRKRTGRGQYVDLAQVECMFPLVAPWIIEQSATGQLAPRIGNRHRQYVPHGCFACAGADSWIVIAVADDSEWLRLCEVIDRPDLAADPALLSVAGRRGVENDLERVISAWSASIDADDAMRLLQAHGVSAGVARSPHELLLRDPHLDARGFWQKVSRDFVGDHFQPSLPFRENADPYPVRTPAPTLGQHTEDVLRACLSMTDDELAELRAAAVTGSVAVSIEEKHTKSRRSAVGPRPVVELKPVVSK
jgi:crotonobetainyl-CoA:carnitine CoA-transferase CaiB-like acyl-CoA transferase